MNTPLSMALFEAACVAVVGLYVFLRLAGLAGADDRARVARRLALLSVAGWIGEDTVIRAYGFYGYAPSWSPMLDQAPVLVACIWPIVIDSAAQLARRLAPRQVALAAAGIVLADAALIEPIAVHAGLWAWTRPGFFAVPPVGILGWALFAFAAVAVLEELDRRRAPAVLDAIVPIVAPLATHVMLIAAWWALFKWISGTWSDWAVVAAAWTVSAALAGRAWRGAAGAHVPRRELLVRLPGAAVFLVLLVAAGGRSFALALWALAFVPPYLALLVRSAPREMAFAAQPSSD